MYSIPAQSSRLRAAWAVPMSAVLAVVTTVVAVAHELCFDTLELATGPMTSCQCEWLHRQLQATQAAHQSTPAASHAPHFINKAFLESAAFADDLEV